MSEKTFAQLSAEIDSANEIPGVLMTDVLTLPDTLRRLIGFVLREKLVSVAETSEYLEQPDHLVGPLMGRLVEKGYLESSESFGQTFYRVKTVNPLPRRPNKGLLEIFEDPQENQ